MLESERSIMYPRVYLSSDIEIVENDIEVLSCQLQANEYWGNLDCIGNSSTTVNTIVIEKKKMTSFVV